MVTTCTSMSITHNENCKIIEANQFRTNHINMSGTETNHVKIWLNCRRKRKRDPEYYIQRSTRRQRRYYTVMGGRKVEELNN